MFTLAYKDDAAWNESRWKNPRFNELLLAAKAELDDTKRAEMYREMSVLMRDDGTPSEYATSSLSHTSVCSGDSGSYI